jgi:hypothetical protein
MVLEWACIELSYVGEVLFLLEAVQETLDGLVLGAAHGRVKTIMPPLCEFGGAGWYSRSGFN